MMMIDKGFETRDRGFCLDSRVFSKGIS